MEGIMTTSPYTHPSMPGTPPMVFDLPAALEDAEGIALVEAIHQRKADSLRVLIDGEWKDPSAPSGLSEMFAEPGLIVDAPPIAVDSVTWPSDNRKLYARRDGEVSELYRFLGVTPNDSDNSQIQQDADHR
jgi:hypothetical protein